MEEEERKISNNSTEVDIQEKNKCMRQRLQKVACGNYTYFSATAGSVIRQKEKIKKKRVYYKKRLGRVDRNKSSDITEDKMRKDSTRSCTLSGTRDGASSENKSGRRRRRGDEGKNVRRTVVFSVGFCRASEIAAVYLT